MKKTNHVDLENARFDDQKKVMQEIIQNDESPFLLKNLRKYHQLPILKEGKYWYVTANQWPYEHTLQHFLIIAQEYWTDIAEITPAAAAEFMALAQWLTKEYQVPGGAFCMRFGDTNYSAASVNHLHAQFIVPDISAADFEPTKFKIGKSKSQR